MKNDAMNNDAAITLEQKNADAKRFAMDAARDAVKAAYKNNAQGFLKALYFDKNEKPYSALVRYPVFTLDGYTLIENDAYAVLRLSLYDFIESKESKACLRDRLDRLAALASENTSESRAAAMPLIANICTICGLHEYGAKVNERDAKRILRAAYTVTGMNNDDAKTRAVRDAVHAMLYSMVCGKDIRNAYKDRQAAKAAADAAKAAAKAAEKYAMMQAAADAAQNIARDALAACAKADADADAVADAAKAAKAAKAKADAAKADADAKAAAKADADASARDALAAKADAEKPRVLDAKAAYDAAKADADADADAKASKRAKAAKVSK